MNNLKINDEMYIDETGKYHSHKPRNVKRTLTNEQISKLSDDEFDKMFRGETAPGEDMVEKQNRRLEIFYNSQE